MAIAKVTPDSQVIKWDREPHKSILTEVDLIVPFYGQYAHLSRLIESLWSTTRGIYYNLCLVDDGSPNQEFLRAIEKKKYPSVICVRHEKRQGFGAALNSGLQATQSPWIVLLNSDVEFVNPNWLSAIGDTYENLRKHGIKMVSAQMDNIPPGDPRILKEDHSSEDLIIEPQNLDQILVEDQFLPFVCVLAHRELFTRVGLIRPYPLGWYEDTEFACRMFMKGFRQGVSGKSFVKHVGAATINSICETEKKLKPIFENNYNLLCRDVENLRTQS